MGIDYCNCKDCGEKEKKSEYHMLGQKINYDQKDLKLPSTNPTINNSFENSFRNDPDISNKNQDSLTNINQPEKLARKMNIETYTISRNNENKIVSSPLSLIKEKDQEDEVSEIENMKKSLIRYNNNNEYCYNKILINNNNSKINIYEDNSYNIRYVNENDNNQVIFNNKLKSISPRKQKNIIYRNDLKKDNKKQIIYEKKINLLNNNFSKVKYLDSFDDYDIKDEYGTQMMYKKVNVVTPKISIKSQQKYKNNKIFYDLNV